MNGEINDISDSEINQLDIISEGDEEESDSVADSGGGSVDDSEENGVDEESTADNKESTGDGEDMKDDDSYSNDSCHSTADKETGDQFNSNYEEDSKEHENDINQVCSDNEFDDDLERVDEDYDKDNEYEEERKTKQCKYTQEVMEKQDETFFDVKDRLKNNIYMTPWEFEYYLSQVSNAKKKKLLKLKIKADEKRKREEHEEVKALDEYTDNKNDEESYAKVAEQCDSDWTDSD